MDEITTMYENECAATSRGSSPRGARMMHTCARPQHHVHEEHECWCGERWLVGARVELSEGE